MDQTRTPPLETVDTVVSFLTANEPVISAIVGIMTLVAAGWGLLQYVLFSRRQREVPHGTPSASAIRAALNMGINEHSKLEELVAIRTVNVAFFVLMAISFPWLLTAFLAWESPVLSAINLLVFAVALLGVLLQQAGALGLARWLLMGDTLFYWFSIMLAVGPYHGSEYFMTALVALPVLTLSRDKSTQRLICIAILLMVFLLGAYVSHNIEPLQPLGPEALRLGYYGNAVLLAGAISGLVVYYKGFAAKGHRLLAAQKSSNDALVSKMLPADLAEKISRQESPEARWHSKSTVLYGAVTGFSQIYTDLTPEDLVDKLADLFAIFDDIAIAHRVEKVKTFGTTYIAAAGLEASVTGDKQIANCALAMRDATRKFARQYELPLELRCGIASGLAISGVIGRSRPRFDLWGEALDEAAQTQALLSAGEIAVNAAAYQRLSQAFKLEAHPNARSAYRLEPQRALTGG